MGNVNITNGLVGHWTMDASDTSGTTVLDKSGNGNNGTLFGNLTISTGKINHAMYSSARGKYLKINGDSPPSAALMPTDAITVSAWVRADSLTNVAPNAFAMIMTTAESAAMLKGYGLFWYQDLIRFTINSWADKAAYFSFPSTLSGNNLWYHVVGTYDKNAGSAQVNIYLNGVKGTPNTDTGSIDYTGSILSRIGDDYGYTVYDWVGKIDDVRVYNRALSAEEVKILYYDSPPSPAKTFSSSIYSTGQELVADGNMEAVGTTSWTAANGATLSKQPARVLGGSQVLRVAYNGTANPAALQAILTAGKKYLISGYCRGDGVAAYPTISALTGSSPVFIGTTGNSWQNFESIITAPNTSLVLFAIASAAGYAEFDNISCKEVDLKVKAPSFKTDFGIHISYGNETGGNLSNSLFKISTGTWKISDSSINGKEVKTILNVSAGILYLPIAGQLETAYGTWEFSVYKSNTANVADVMLVCDTIGGGAAAGQDGYGVRFDSDETIALFESVAGTPTDLVSSTAKSLATWYRIKITRDKSNLFSFYLNNVLIGTATDATVTSGTYIALDLDAGDMVALSDRFGDNSFCKYNYTI